MLRRCSFLPLSLSLSSLAISLLQYERVMLGPSWVDKQIVVRSTLLNRIAFLYFGIEPTVWLGAIGDSSNHSSD